MRKLNIELLIFAGYLTFSFLTLVKPGYNAFPIQINDNLSYFLSLFFGLLLGLKLLSKCNSKDLVHRIKSNPFYFTFIILVILSFFFNILGGLYESYSSIKTFSFLTLGILNYYIIPHRLTFSSRLLTFWRSYIITISTISSIIAVLGVFEFFPFFGWNSFDEKILVINMRSTASILFEPNIFAYLVMFGVFYTHIIENLRPLTKASLIIIQMLGLFFSYSRGAWLCILLYFFLYYLSKSRYKKIIILFSSIILLITVPIIIQINEIFSVLNLDNPLTGRLELWKLSIQKSLENPLFGLGLSANRLNEIFLSIGHNFTTSHNLIIDSLLTSGIIATILYVLSFIYPIFLGFYTSKKIAFNYEILFAISAFVFLQFSPHNIGGASFMAVNTAFLFGKISLHERKI